MQAVASRNVKPALEARVAPSVGTHGCGRCSCSPYRLASSERPRRGAPVAASETETKATTSRNDDLMIEGLSTDYCDDFECTSSPAIEQTVRALARDLVALRYTPRLFQPDVKYQDGLRSFTGYDKYRRTFWIKDSVRNPQVTIKRIQMADKSNALIEWRLRGSVAVFPVDINYKSEFELNQLTGRVITHRESWDLGSCSPPAALAATASRAAWSAKQTSKDAKEGIDKVTDTFNSMGSDDEEFMANPSDPTRFFQSGGNNQMNDAVSIALVVSFLYLAYKGFAELEKLS